MSEGEGVDFLSIALSFARLGFPVFPLSQGTKVPIKGTQGFKMATQVPEVIRQWAQQWPAANVGYVPAPRAIILDIDRSPDTNDSLKKLNLPRCTFVVATPSGGYHVAFKHPGGVIGNDGAAWRREYPGINVRADSGYVLAPGSWLAAAKRSYTFVGPFIQTLEFLPTLPAAAAVHLNYKGQV